MAANREKQLQGAQKVLDRNRKDAYKLANTKGKSSTIGLMEDAAKQLRERLSGLSENMEDSFTANQMNATLKQIELVTRELTNDLGEVVVGEVKSMARTSAQDTAEYLARVDKAHRGLGEQGLAIKESTMLDRAVQGAESSTLRRLAGAAEDP